MKSIAVIRSGGQTGVDRGALDAALLHGVSITGWVPKGGWAEDMISAPGVMGKYPGLKETRSSSPDARTELNVRDSHATLLILPTHLEDIQGTKLTLAIAKKYKRPFFVSNGNDLDETIAWIESLPFEITLNVAGPRESEFAGIYNIAFDFISSLLKLKAL
jgi:hypothetical protein